MTATNLQIFQREFGDYIRKQSHDDTDNIPNRVGQLYQKLIYNNIANFIHQCFPICRQIIDDKTWQALLLAFIKDGNMTSPYFSQINEQFVEYLQTSDIVERLNLYPFIAELAHYEWIELYVDNLPNTPPKLFLHDKHLSLNSTAQILHYHYAVNKISIDNLPADTEQTFILVYRTADNKTAFISLNSLSFIILTFIKETDKVYQDIDSLIQAISNYFNIDKALININELFTLLIDNQVIINQEISSDG